MMNGLKDSPIFELGGSDLYYLAKTEYKLSWNGLSPFHGQPETGETLSEEIVKLSKDSDLKSVAQILANPILKVQFNKGGTAIPIQSFSAYFSKEYGQAKCVVLYKEERGMNAIFLKSIDDFAGFFAGQNASVVMNSPLNIISGEEGMPIEALIAIFNLTDCYRRAYLNTMLSNSEEPVRAIFEEEFMAVLENSLKSGDIRWLLPSLLRLVPGLSNSVLEFKADQLDLLERLTFIRRVADPNTHKPIYSLGGSGQYMGLEFTHFWKYAVGFDISKLGNDNKSVERMAKYYFAPTDEANHLISIKGEKDNLVCLHDALSFDEVVVKMKEILLGLV